jgi:hypothetical protein
MVPVPRSRLQPSRIDAIEHWPWLDQEVLRTSRSRQVCMTCHFFRHHPGPNCCIGASCRPIRPGWNQQLNGGADGPVSESFRRREHTFVERYRSSGSGLAGSGELRSGGPQRPRHWIQHYGSVYRDAPW